MISIVIRSTVHYAKDEFKNTYINMINQFN